jgi:hypothetical protein
LPAARLLALLFICSPAPGCSAFGIVRPPKPAPATGEGVDCTRSRALPWADTVIASLAAAGTVATSTIDCQGSGCDVKAQLLIPQIVATVAYGVSALWGHRAVSECHGLLAQRAENAP